MPTNLQGQFDLTTATEGTALPSNTDVASFTDPNTADTASAFTATIDWGDGTTTPGTVVGSNGSFTVQGGHTYTDEDSVLVTVNVLRPADNSQLTIQDGLSVSDADNLTGHSAPTIVANPNQALTNVTVATFTDTYTGNTPSDFITSIDWGDGTTTPGTLSGSGGNFTVKGSHTYVAPGDYTITTFMNDDAPESAFAFATTEAAIGFGGDETLHSATEFTAIPSGTQVADFVDNSNLASNNYTATIDWGDGTTTPGTVSGSNGSYTVLSASGHTYTDEGDFTLIAHITRTTDNAIIAPSGTVTVDEGDILSASGTTIHGNLALSNVTVATFTDSITANVASDFTANIDWGDGVTTVGTISGSNGSFTVTGSHTYAQGGQNTVSVVVFDDAPGTASALATSTITLRPYVVNDFNGDGNSDVLLQNGSQQTNTGPLALWEMNGGQVIATPGIGDPGSTWHLIATGDFNADGHTGDILFQNDNGTLGVWELNGGQIVGAPGFGNPGTTWHAVGVGDFNADGTSDVVLRNDNGTVALWETNGGQVIATPGIGNPGTTWHVIRVGDFNGDGSSDLLFQNDNGTLGIWEMNGGQVLATPGIGNPGATWHVDGVGDFNGDGKADILFQNDNGTLGIWEMNGGQILAAPGPGNPGTTWRAAGVGDYNGDGNSDILFQNTNGTLAIWEMNGGQVLATPGLGNPGSTWHPQPA
jgi:hypothetical protein